MKMGGGGGFEKIFRNPEEALNKKIIFLLNFFLSYFLVNDMLV